MECVSSLFFVDVIGKIGLDRTAVLTAVILSRECPLVIAVLVLVKSGTTVKSALAEIVSSLTESGAGSVASMRFISLWKA